MDEWQAYWEAYTQWQQAYNDPANWEDRVFGTTTTGDDGRFRFELYAGTYMITCERQGYLPYQQWVTVPVAGEVCLDIPLGYLCIEATITDMYTGAPVAGAEVTVFGVGSAVTNGEGVARIPYGPQDAGEHQWKVTRVPEGYIGSMDYFIPIEAEITEAEQTAADVRLEEEMCTQEEQFLVGELDALELEIDETIQQSEDILTAEGIPFTPGEVGEGEETWSTYETGATPTYNFATYEEWVAAMQANYRQLNAVRQKLATLRQELEAIRGQRNTVGQELADNEAFLAELKAFVAVQKESVVQSSALAIASISLTVVAWSFPTIGRVVIGAKASGTLVSAYNVYRVYNQILSLRTCQQEIEALQARNRDLRGQFARWRFEFALKRERVQAVQEQLRQLQTVRDAIRAAKPRG
jgi:hypothetical protein